MGLNTGALRSEFDSANLIVHVSANEPVHARTRADGYALSEAVQAILKRHLGDRRGYLIIDYTHIIIEPLFIDEYAGAIKKIVDTYLHPDGIARYGFGIGRVTARLGNAPPNGVPLNLFSTRAEAEAYINSLINDDDTDSEARQTVDDFDMFSPIYRPFQGQTKPEY